MHLTNVNEIVIINQVITFEIITKTPRAERPTEAKRKCSMERDVELKKQIESTLRNVSKIIRKTAKKFKTKDPKNIEPFKKIFEYCQKISDLITSSEYVFWAYERLAKENEMPSATKCVKDCLKELNAMLNELLAENGSTAIN